MSKRLYLPIQLPQTPGRFKLETRLINSEMKWCVVEKATDEVVDYGSTFEMMRTERDRLEKEFPKYPVDESPKLSQVEIDKMPISERPTSLWRQIIWNAQR